MRDVVMHRRNYGGSRRAVQLVALCCTAALWASACGEGGDADGIEPQADIDSISSPEDIDLSGMTIPIVDVGVLGPFDMGGVRLREKLEEWGATIERTELTSVSATQALLAGEGGFAAEGPDAVITAVAQGAELAAIGAANSQTKYVLVTRNEISDVEDLEGRTVGISGPGGFDTLLNRYLLGQAGLEPGQDVRFVQIGDTQSRAAALLAGNIDATTFFMENWLNLQQQSDSFKLMKNMSDVLPNVVSDVFFSTREYWESNPEVALAVACANSQINKEFFADKERYIEYGLEHTQGYSREAIAETYEFSQDVGMNPTETADIMPIEGTQALIDVMVETGEIDEAIDPESIVDMSYLQRAEEIGC